MIRMPRVMCCLPDLGVRREPPGSTTLVSVLYEPTTGLHLADIGLAGVGRARLPVAGCRRLYARSA
jgi:hypothetical protein